MMKRSIIILLAAIIVVAGAALRFFPHEKPRPYLPAIPAYLRQGKIALLKINNISSLRNADTLKAFFDSVEAPIILLNNQRYILVAVDYEKALGTYPLTVIREGQEIIEDSVRIIDGRFPVRRLSFPYEPAVAAKKDRRVAERIRTDRSVMRNALTRKSPNQLWDDLAFGFPLDSIEITSPFGTTRIYTNQKQGRPHTGVDLNTGFTPVKSIGKGRVLWASGRQLYLEGKMVVIDHGQGIISLYMHLSRVKVNDGAEVNYGQIIATSGQTGNARGTHLHLNVRVGEALVDPIQFVKVFRAIAARK
ncbi:MAG: hypothetical protein A2939_05145 [Parcubacteria group bacterium RIFCSPLOWO2_01_FULL_48_18]|nr:MAG: hypothetical protein A2939_05145 [Parcubacteria group bacterium RIFCSPLOWO2_01_FULL_48_18]